MADDIAKILWDFPAIDPRTAIIAVDPGAYCIIPDETRAMAAREIERLLAENDMMRSLIIEAPTKEERDALFDRRFAGEQSTPGKGS